MEQLQQANVGNPENIGQSVQAAEYSPLKYQMELGTKLMDAGFQGGSATNRQAMSNQAEMDKLRYAEDSAIRTERRSDAQTHRSNIGTLTQIIAEFDDVIDNADMADPVVQERLPALIRKRDQLSELLSKNGRNPKYLGGILKYGVDNETLTPEWQGKTRERLATRMNEESEKQNQSQKTEEKPKENKESSNETASSNVIHL